MLLLHMFARAGSECIVGQSDRADLWLEISEKVWHLRQNDRIVIGCLRVASQVHNGLGIRLIVENSGQTVLLQIDDAGQWIESHVMRLKDGSHLIIVEVRNG